MNPTTLPRRSVLVQLFGMMTLEYFIWGAWLPLIWTYMGGLGFSGAQIAWVGSTFAIASILAIFVGNQYVDRTFAAERFMAGSHLIGGLAMLGLFFVHDFWPFFVLMLVHSICYVPTLSIANSLAFSHLSNAQNEFGRVRMGGTIGWILASWPLYFVLQGKQGAALQHALSSIFIVAGSASIVLALLSLFLPHTPPRRSLGMVGEPLAWREALRCLGERPYLLVLLVVTLIDSTVHNGYFLMAVGFFEAIGVKPENIMPLMSIGQVTEIITMAALGFCLKRLGWKPAMLIGVLGYVVRFLIFAFCSQSLALIIAAQVLHGICYGFFFATLYIFIDVAFPQDIRTSGQGIFNLLILGLGDLGAKWLFLPLQAHFNQGGVIDYHRLFLVPAGMSLFAALLLSVAFRPPTDQPRTV